MRRSFVSRLRFGLGACLLLAAGAVTAQPDPTSAAAGRARRLAQLRREVESAHPPAAAEISERLTDLAREYLENNDPAQAIELLSEAVARDPENGTALAHLILAYLKNEDFDFADFYLDQATQTADRRNPDPGVYSTIGDLYAARNRLHEAVSAWDYYLRLGGSEPAVLERLERSRRELSVKQGQRLLSGDHFAIYTDATISEEVAERVEAHLEQEYRSQSEFFGAPLAGGPQVVILYEGRAYFSLVSIPTWVSAIFDGKIRVSLEAPARWTWRLEAVLSHELAHAFIRHLSGGHAPGWLHEGLAQWFEGKRLMRSELREVFSRQPLRKLAEMEGSLAHRGIPAIAQSNYIESLGLIEYLIQERGPGAVACLVRALGAGDPLEEALRRQTGFTSPELLAGFRAWIGLGR
jgi:tetratricopeptide (TPR) repeat protein